jgi:hypothetical protein
MIIIEELPELGSQLSYKAASVNDDGKPQIHICLHDFCHTSPIRETLARAVETSIKEHRSYPTRRAACLDLSTPG